MIPNFLVDFTIFLREMAKTGNDDDDDNNSEKETKPVKKEIHFRILMRMILIMSSFTIHDDLVQFRMSSLFPFRFEIK